MTQTSDNLEATLIDDSLFGDIFTMQSQFLDDFEFGLEANNIDTLLELFEGEENKCDSNTNKINNVFKNNSESVERNDNIIMISLPKVRKSTNSASDVSSTKRKGTSLLAKPKKSSPNRSPKRSLIEMNERNFQTISSYLLQDHDYCLISDDNKLYNKIPDYLTDFSNISKSITSNNSSNESFDKIPDYIKGFLNLSENIDKTEDFIANNDNILIEFNEAYIEVSDVVFDNDLYSNDKTDCEVCGEDFNSESSNYSNIMSSEESKDVKELDDILTDNQFLTQTEQNDSNNYSNRNESNASNRRSRSRSREQRNQSFVKNRTQRRRRLSTRSSVDSKSDSSSCSSCSSCDSYSSRSSDDSKVNFDSISNSIIRNETNGQPLSKKRSLKESYCQKNFESKVRVKNRSESVFNVKSGGNCISFKTKKDIEERKIIYVGKIPDGTTKTDIRYWFGQFGAIKEVSIHFRDRGDNYAFVTFHRRTDAFQAIEHANDDSRHPKFDLSFGGRRQFCKTRYEDLDFAEDESAFRGERMDFDSLLRSTKTKLNR